MQDLNFCHGVDEISGVGCRGEGGFGGQVGRVQGAAQQIFNH